MLAKTTMGRVLLRLERILAQTAHVHAKSGTGNVD
jgi:hypothetical protein